MPLSWQIFSREVLLSQLLGCLQAPMGKFVVYLTFSFQNLWVSERPKEKKEQAQ